VACEQAYAEGLLQAPQGIADGRLAKPQAGGRTADAADLEDRVEYRQEVQIDSAYIHDVNDMTSRQLM
jgi:hypothetical protein